MNLHRPFSVSSNSAIRLGFRFLIAAIIASSADLRASSKYATLPLVSRSAHQLTGTARVPSPNRFTIGPSTTAMSNDVFQSGEIVRGESRKSHERSVITHRHESKFDAVGKAISVEPLQYFIGEGAVVFDSKKRYRVRRFSVSRQSQLWILRGQTRRPSVLSEQSNPEVRQ